MPHILLINGPNLNKLGEREPKIYGRETLSDIETKCKKTAKGLKLEVDCFQSNIEGEIVSKIQQAGKKYKGLLINAGAYTHTSIAIMDALLALKIPAVEVHMSNIYRREPFRHESFVAKAATGSICGFGSDSYLLALQAMHRLLNK